MPGDDNEHLDEHGDVPAIELSTDPIAEIPQDELLLIGEIMAWTAYIETDLFLLFILANPGDPVRRRKQFYKQTAGLYARIKLVRQSYEVRLQGDHAEALARLLQEAEALAKFRNDIAHNPVIRFGPKRALMRWMIGSGDFAGNLAKADSSIVRPLLPHLRRLHQNLQSFAALINSPEGKSFAVAFGVSDERVEAQIARYLAAASPPME